MAPTCFYRHILRRVVSCSVSSVCLSVCPSVCPYITPPAPTNILSNSLCKRWSLTSCMYTTCHNVSYLIHIWYNGWSYHESTPCSATTISVELLCLNMIMIFPQLEQREFSQLSFVRYMGLCVFSLHNSPVMIVRMCTLSYYHHQIGSMNH